MWFRFKFRDPDKTVPRWEPRGEDVKTYTASSHRRNMAVSDLEELTNLTGDDCLLVTHPSGKICQSMKVKLSTLKKFIIN
jgi:hypothetical protein